MKYGKVENRNLILAPHMIILNGMQIFNPLKKHLEEVGYKEVVETESPEELPPEGQHYEKYYEDKGLVIESVWELVKNEDIPPKQKL